MTNTPETIETPAPPPTVIDRVHSAFSSIPIEVKGCFHLQGPQTFGGNGAPEWVRDVMTNDPTVDQIIVNKEKSGAVYSRF